MRMIVALARDQLRIAQLWPRVDVVTRLNSSQHFFANLTLLQGKLNLAPIYASTLKSRLKGSRLKGKS